MKRSNLVLMLLVGVTFAAIAWAAPGPIIDLMPRWEKAGLFIGPTASVATASKNKITATVTADVDYNFPSGTIVCTDTPATPAVGVKAGDPCFLGMGPRDGGVQSIVAINSTFMAFSDAVNTVKVRHCPAGTAIDPPDSGFVVRCISSQ